MQNAEGVRSLHRNPVLYAAVSCVQLLRVARPTWHWMAGARTVLVPALVVDQKNAQCEWDSHTRSVPCCCEEQLSTVLRISCCIMFGVCAHASHESLPASV
jgi:hypothetical protein